jgi:LasA protease
VAVQAQVDRAAHRSATRRVLVSVLRVREGWAYGDAVLPAGAHDEGVGVPSTFIARAIKSHWRVALGGTSRFLKLLRASPRGFISGAVRKLYLAENAPPGPLGGSGPSEPGFSLPWATGETWLLWFGPHNTDSDSGPHPYTSLDFAGGDGIVRAAAAGVVYRPCANLVVIDHGGGWETGYYHLPTSSIVVHTGQTVSAGAPLGHIGTSTGCGGVAHGAHVHFSIYHFGKSGVYNVFQTPSADMNGDVIGGWVVHDGSSDGRGSMQRIRDGLTVAPTDFGGSGAIYNDGSAGGGQLPVVPSGYRTLAAVNIYAGPGIPYAYIGSLPSGAPVNIACQTRGTSIAGSSIWDNIGNGRYIPDYYVSTAGIGIFTAGIPQCTPEQLGLHGGTSKPGGGAASCTGGGTTLSPPNTLCANQQLTSPSGQYSLVMQQDGNLVLYSERFSPTRALWSSGTFNNPGVYVAMQGDGNLVVYGTSGRALWNSGTFNHPGAHLALQDDGNLVVYGPDNTPLWNAGTNNLLSNPSFEQLPGAPGWGRNANAGNENIQAYGDASRAHDGVGFLEANTSVVGGSIAQDVAVTPQPGRTYTFSIWLRSPDGSPFSVCVAIWFLGGTNSSGSNCTSVGGAWQDILVAGLAGGGHTSMRAEIYLKTTTHNLDFDTATLVGM